MNLCVKGKLDLEYGNDIIQATIIAFLSHMEVENNKVHINTHSIKQVFFNRSAVGWFVGRNLI